MRSEGILQAGNKRGLWGKQAGFQVAEGHPPKTEGRPRAKSEEVVRTMKEDSDKAATQVCKTCSGPFVQVSQKAYSQQK